MKKHIFKTAPKLDLDRDFPVTWNELEPYARDVAGQLLNIKIESELTDIQCPGCSMHTNEDGDDHTHVYLDGDMAPTINCVHESCSGLLDDLNHELRSRIGYIRVALQAYKADKMSMYDRCREAAYSGVYVPDYKNYKPTAITRKKESSIMALKEKHIVNLKEPTEFPQGEEIPVCEIKQTKLHLSLFKKVKGKIMIGEKNTSGDWAANHFKDFKELSEGKLPGGTLISQTTFSGNYRRKSDIVEDKFCVFESDELSHENSMKRFKEIYATYNLKPLLILDSAGKSLHAWYVRNDVFTAFNIKDKTNIKEFGIIIEALQLDKAAVRTAQPVRLAGRIRKGKTQKLIYFNNYIK